MNEWVNPLSANPEKWSNTLKQIVGNLPTNCLSVFDHFMNLALKGLNKSFIVNVFIGTENMSIIEWNKLDPTLWNSESFGKFKNNIFKFVRPKPIVLLTASIIKGLDLSHNRV